MIPKHTQFIAALNEKKKICVRFYSKPDSGVLDRVCAPMDYGPGNEIKNGLHRYWLWNYEGDAGSHTLGLVPEQIVDLKVLGEGFDPAQFTLGTSPALVFPTDGLPPAPVVSSGDVTVLILFMNAPPAVAAGKPPRRQPEAARIRHKAFSWPPTSLSGAQLAGSSGTEFRRRSRSEERVLATGQPRYTLNF